MANTRSSSQKTRKGKWLAPVIPIDSWTRSREVRQLPAKPSAVAPVQRPDPITQARLQKGLELFLEEARITRALTEFKMQMQADVAAGAEIEPGELLFDPECKIVRRSPRSKAR